MSNLGLKKPHEYVQKKGFEVHCFLLPDCPVVHSVPNFILVSSQFYGNFTCTEIVT